MKRHWPAVMPALLAASIFHAWFAPGLLIGDDFFRFSSDVLKSDFPWRSMWDQSYVLGISSAVDSPSFPLWSLVGLIARLGGGFALAERLVWFWPLFIALVASPYALVYRLSRQPWASAVAASVFAINTWTISLVQRGHIGSLVAYAVMPLVLLAFAAWMRRLDLRSSVVLASTLTLQVMYDLRYAYIAAIACAVVGAFAAVRAMRDGRAPVGRVLSGVALAAGSLAVFNMYWIAPQLLAPAALPAGYDSLTYFYNASRFESLWHSLLLFDPFYHYTQGTDPFAASPPELAFAVIPLAAAVSLVLVRRSRYALPILCATAIGIIITAGPVSPLGPVVTFAFTHVPGMSLFRDISKFSALVALCYATAIGLGFARLSAMVRQRRASPRVRWAIGSVAAAATVAWAGIMHDAYNPARASNFATTALSADDVAVQRFIDDQQGFVRTLVFPTWRPELVGTAAHPLVGADYLLDSALQDGGLRDLFAPSDSLFDRLSSPLVPDLLDAAGVRYIIVDDDPRHQLYEPSQFDLDHQQAIDFFDSRPWVTPLRRIGGYAIYAVKSAPDAPAYIEPTVATMDGDPSELEGLAGSPLWTSEPAIITGSERVVGRATLGTVTGAHREAYVTVGGARQPMAVAVSRAAYGTPTQTPAPEQLAAWVDTPPRGHVEVFLTGHADGDARQRVAVDWFAGSKATPIESMPREATLLGSPLSIVLADQSLMPAPPTADGADWLGATRAGFDLDVLNIAASPRVADLRLVCVSPDGHARLVQISAGGRSATVSLSGRAIIELHGAAFPAGDTSVHVSIAGADGRPWSGEGFSILIRADGAVAEANAASPVLRLPTGVRILRARPLHVDAEPIVSVTYAAQRSHTAAAVFLLLRPRTGGTPRLLATPLPWSNTRASIDVAAALRAALASDANAGQNPRQPSDFDLDGVWIATSGPPASPSTFRVDDAMLDADAAAAPVDDVGRADLQRARIDPAAQMVMRSPTAAVLRIGGQARIDVPIDAAPNASDLRFWESAPDGQMVPSLGYRCGDGRSGRVLAAGRPELVDADVPLPESWQHIAASPLGDARPWRRIDLDLDAVRAYRLRDQARCEFTDVLIDVLPESADAGDAEIADAVLVGRSARDASATIATDAGQPIAVLWRARPDIGDLAAHVVLPPLDTRTHRVVALPGSTRLDGMAVVTGPRAPLEQPPSSATVKRISQTERLLAFPGTGGLLVDPDAYATGWRLAIVQKGAPPLSGVTLLDALKLRSAFVAPSTHVVVDGIFNGWTIPRGSSAAYAIYLPEAVSEASALVWVVTSLALLALARRRP